MILELKNIYKAYPNTNFKLQNINLKLTQNEILGIIGQNGSGKSTILKMINGLVSIDQGNVYLHNQIIDYQNANQLQQLRRKIAYIFQNGNLLEKQSVEYHLRLVYKIQKKPINVQKIQEMVTFFNLHQHLKTPVYYLSGGQKQKVAIAMAILAQAEILLCDEISSQLDYNSEIELFNFLVKLKQVYNISIIMISHNLNLVKAYCDRVYLLDDNTLIDEINLTNTTVQMLKPFSQYIKEYLNA